MLYVAFAILLLALTAVGLHMCRTELNTLNENLAEDSRKFHNGIAIRDAIARGEVPTFNPNDLTDEDYEHLRELHRSRMNWGYTPSC